MCVLCLLWWPQEIWSECFLFCLPLKIYDCVETNAYYYCTCEPFLCEKYSHNPDHERVPNCYNCKISGDCSGLNRYWQHCILYNCDECAFRDNLAEICTELGKGKDNIHIISYTLNKFSLFFIVIGVLDNQTGKNMTNIMII